jgi:hypothetical protein
MSAAYLSDKKALCCNGVGGKTARISTSAARALAAKSVISLANKFPQGALWGIVLAGRGIHA